MIKKFSTIFLTLFFLFFQIQNLSSENNNKIIISVGDFPITYLDLVQEMKLVAILSNIRINQENQSHIQNLAVQSLIRRQIKSSEVERLNIRQYSKKDLNGLVAQTSKNIGLDKNELKELLEKHGLNFKDLIKRFEVDLRWNTLIFELYKNKISLNTVEIENKINLKAKEIEKDKLSPDVYEKIKKNIVRQEKEKKLHMFSNSHYSGLERMMQVKQLY